MNTFETLRKLGETIDAAEDAADTAALEDAVRSLKSLKRDSMIPMELARIHCYIANALAALRHLQPTESPWWDQPHFEEEMLERRLALNAIKECASAPTLECQVLTNLGNAFNNAGRFSEALSFWNRALAIKPRFGMALANRGLCYYDFARYFQTVPEQTYLLRDSHASLGAGLSAGVEAHAYSSIRAMYDHVAGYEDWTNLPAPELPFPEGISAAEREYRRWCRGNGLYLSPLNDLFNLDGIEDIADSLHLPNITIPVTESSEEPPAVYGMFNQAKQEFICARYLAYEAIREKEANELHFCERDAFLVDMLDYRLYRLWVERLKMSFLAAHAILDKLAYLMNIYWNFGLAADKVSFGGIWFKNGRPKEGISQRTKQLDNWPLRGLFWLSRDFYNSRNPLVPPDARRLHEIRNHIAHKYLRVHDELIGQLPRRRKERSCDLSYQVTGEELLTHTLQLLKLVRSTMMYLTAAMAHEEAEKAKERGDGLIAPMNMFTVYAEDRL